MSTARTRMEFAVEAPWTHCHGQGAMRQLQWLWLAVPPWLWGADTGEKGWAALALILQAIACLTQASC